MVQKTLRIRVQTNGLATIMKDLSQDIVSMTTLEEFTKVHIMKFLMLKAEKKTIQLKDMKSVKALIKLANFK